MFKVCKEAFDKQQIAVSTRTAQQLRRFCASSIGTVLLFFKATYLRVYMSSDVRWANL